MKGKRCAPQLIGHRCIFSLNIDDDTVASTYSSSSFPECVCVCVRDVAAQLIILPQPLHCRTKDTSAPSPTASQPAHMLTKTVLLLTGFQNVKAVCGNIFYDKSLCPHAVFCYGLQDYSHVVLNNYRPELFHV